jgi:hypothetical protein
VEKLAHDELGYKTEPPFEIGGENHYFFRFQDHPECMHFLTDGNPTRKIKKYLRSRATTTRNLYDEWLETLPKPQPDTDPAPKRTRPETNKERRGRAYESGEV